MTGLGKLYDLKSRHIIACLDGELVAAAIRVLQCLTAYLLLDVLPAMVILYFLHK